MKNNILVFGTKNFNNSLNEIKEYLNFSLIFFNINTFTNLSINLINAVLVENEISNNTDVLRSINTIKNKPILLLKKHEALENIKFIYDGVITLPLSLKEISNKVTNLVTTKKFKQNSCVSINDYVIDKNERKLKKEKLSITITEREIELIELLFNEKKPISKNIILKRVWKYADDVTTHTIETHIYRLRKKILNKFKDENFIINSKTGYSI